jgi:ribosome-associated translation inhibitor RaiA
MQVQLNTDNNVVGSTELALQLEGEVHAALGRFADRITRVEVHITDLNSDNKTGGDDKRCMLEARLSGRQPMSASHEAASVSMAIEGACDKLARALDRLLGKLDADQRSGARQANDDAASAARSDGPSAAER